jgi:hypothetical protein
MKHTIRKSAGPLFVLLLSFLINPAQAHGAITEELSNLLSQAKELDNQLAQIDMTDSVPCGELMAAHRSALLLIAGLEAQYVLLAPPISLDDNMLQALADLSLTVSSIANRNQGLSLALVLLDATTDRLFISSGMAAMLRLSDDIGVMADRILEMADKILVMADNIGIMADRIIETQLIQNDNIALTQASMLETQQNIIALINPVGTDTYTVEIDTLNLAGNLLAGEISATLLTPLNLARQWTGMAADVNGLRTQVEALHDAVTTAARTNSFIVDTESYTALADLSIMISSIGIAMEGKAIATEALQSLVSDSTLELSMEGLLQMSADIGVMADRILEMADLILAMADNIGLTADQIIATQQLQSTNYTAALDSVEASQSIAIGIIAVNDL